MGFRQSVAVPLYIEYAIDARFFLHGKLCCPYNELLVDKQRHIKVIKR
jgi:hypothetical protein